MSPPKLTAEVVRGIECAALHVLIRVDLGDGIDDEEPGEVAAIRAALRWAKARRATPKLTVTQRRTLVEVQTDESALGPPSRVNALGQLRKLGLVDMRMNSVSLTPAGRAALGVKSMVPK